MDEKKKRWASYKAMGLGYYHLCTDGWREGRLFHTDSQFAFGMTTVALITLLFPVKIYEFELMPNHVHIILSGLGADSLKAFCFLKRRIRARLVKDGDPPLPETYDFRLIPIEDEQQLKNNIIYVARNPYEKQYAVPGGYLWGSGYLFQSMVAERTVQRMTGSLVRIPDHWQIHPEIGILPISFITLSKHIKLFPSPKDYSTALVKDYESLVRIASRLEDDLTFDKKEAEDMTNRLLKELFGGRKLRYLSIEDCPGRRDPHRPWRTHAGESLF